MPNFPTSRRWLALIVAVLAVALFWSGRFQNRRSFAAANAPLTTAVAASQAMTTGLGASLAVAPSYAAPAPRAGSARALFTYAQLANAAVLDAALPAPTQEIHYVRLNRALIAGKQSPFWQRAGAGRVELPLPDGSALAVVIEDSEMLGTHRFVSTGHLEGRPASRAIFAYNGGFLHASVNDPELGSFALRAATEEFSQFYALDPAQSRPCGGAIKPEINASVLAAAAARAARQAALADQSGVVSAVPEVAAAEAGQRPEVHLMIAYTQAVLAAMTGQARIDALQSAFDAEVAKMNDALARSLVNARIKLVKIFETSYATDGPDAGNLISGFQSAALTALQKTDDGRMDDIHAARDAAGADLVMLVHNRRDTASVGLSYVLDTPSSTRQGITANTNPLYAFGVLEYGYLAGHNVLSHELGHCFGNAHARRDPGTTGTKDGAFTYSYGYRFFGANGIQYHDIMAYNPGSELAYFSNPRVIVPSPINQPIGVAEDSANSADAARTIDQTAFEVSTFRLQTQAAVNPGTMVNVSTRAFVGSGDQVLIGGFVLNGPKKVLIRAAGPALLNYGVTNALADPVLTIFSGQNPIAINDDWENQVDLSPPAMIAAAGGFSFAAGSKDAALLVTLNAGAYTAVVEGKNGTTGSALVEVYDPAPGGAKLINLSTRGYVVDNGREMFGGFSVQGAPGTTKRILIRVLGPTLGRMNGSDGKPLFTDVLDDPFMEVHNEKGDLLIQDDDWSTDSQGGISEENDFKPVVQSYSEKAIAATGFAPTNRREPAVMVDLAPGNYTVIVKPFELHDLVLGDQAAQPGIAIIEVYEINP